MMTTQVHVQERKSFASMRRACQECAFASKSFGTSQWATGTANEQQNFVDTTCGSMMWSGVAQECALLRSSTVQRPQSSMVVGLVAARQATKHAKIVRALQTCVCTRGRAGMLITHAKHRKNGVRTRNGARIYENAALECATPRPTTMAIAN